MTTAQFAPHFLRYCGLLITVRNLSRRPDTVQRRKTRLLTRTPSIQPHEGVRTINQQNNNASKCLIMLFFFAVGKLLFFFFRNVGIDSKSLKVTHYVAY